MTALEVNDALAAVKAATDEQLPREVTVLADEVERLRAELADAPRQERERLASFIETNSDVLRSFQDGAMTPEFICFLLRLDHS